MNKAQHVDASPIQQLDQLRQEHRALDERLAQLNSHRYISSEEQMEIKRLKKLKLQKKEQIQVLTG